MLNEIFLKHFFFTLKSIETKKYIKNWVLDFVNKRDTR